MHLKSGIPSKHTTVPIFTIPEHTVLPCCMLIKNTKRKWGNISRIKHKTLAWRILKNQFISFYI